MMMTTIRSSIFNTNGLGYVGRLIYSSPVKEEFQMHLTHFTTAS
ncbi:hypothetical protein LINGRAHAP2_LOCUS23730 [Linum grandiflorum]